MRTIKKFRNKTQLVHAHPPEKDLVRACKVINDPSHIVGNRTGLLETAQRAINFGLDGLMIETHHDPDKCPGVIAKQQVTPRQLREILDQIGFQSIPLQTRAPIRKTARP